MIPKLSKRGFLFTLSAILFATTLIVYSQTYLGISYDNEKAIINASAVASLANINDSISYNMWKLTGLGIDVNVADDLNIHLYERIPKTNVAANITSFELMLNNQYFKRVAGWHELDATDLKDGQVEIYVGDVVTIDANYAGDKTTIYPRGVNSITSIDLNIFVNGPRDDEVVTVAPAGAGTALITIYYIDTNISKPVISESYALVDTGQETSYIFNYAGGETLEVLIGEVGSRTESFQITNNTSFVVDYDVRINYANGAEYLPVRLNSVLRQTLKNANTNTMLKIIN